MTEGAQSKLIEANDVKRICDEVLDQCIAIAREVSGEWAKCDDGKDAANTVATRIDELKSKLNEELEKRGTLIFPHRGRVK